MRIGEAGMRKRVCALLLAVMMLCSGCNMEKSQNRVDTVVWIPVNPTEQPIPEETAETIPEETSETEAVKETEAETTPEETKAEEKSNSTGKKPSGNKGSSDKNNSPKETEPKETEPVQTEPPATQAPETNPTDPEDTEPAPTEPENTLYDISGYVVGSLEYGICDEINAAREESKLSLDGRLSAIASCRANEISRVWSHTRPDGRGYATVLGDYGYSAGGVTELLVYVTGNGDADSIAAKWLESDSHRQSLLNAGYRTIGIGVYRADGYTYVCCLLVN